MNEFLEKFLRKSLGRNPRSWRGTLRAIPAEPLEVIWSFCSWKNSGKTSFVNPGRTLCKKLETNSGRNCGRNAEWFSRHPKVCLESYGTTAIWWSLFIRQPKHKVTRGSLEIQLRIVLMHIGESWYTSGEHSAVGIEMCVWWPHNWSSSNAELHRRDVTKKANSDRN